MIQIGDKVIHSGVEKEVTDVAGDVLILSDGMVVSADTVSKVSTTRIEQREEVPEINKDQLRSDIEALTSLTPVNRVREVVAMVDPTLVISFNLPWDEFKKTILHRALFLRKIDPRVCPTCGQRVAD